jgi:thiol-disulfide isomerase/thioredoxin
VTPTGRAVLAFALVAGAGPVGFLVYHMVFNGSHQLPPPASAPLSAPATRAPAPLAVPVSVPGNVALPDSSGKVHTLAEYRGHPLMLNFWATWCEPCRREIPLLQALHLERGNTVQIVGIAEDFQKDALAYAQAEGITYPLLMGEKDGLAAVNAFGMQPNFPFTVFADAKGDIVAVKIGELHADEARVLLGKVAAVDAGQLDLGDARREAVNQMRNLAISRAQHSAGATTAGGGKS